MSDESDSNSMDEVLRRVGMQHVAGILAAAAEQQSAASAAHRDAPPPPPPPQLPVVERLETPELWDDAVGDELASDEDDEMEAMDHDSIADQHAEIDSGSEDGENISEEDDSESDDGESDTASDSLSDSESDGHRSHLSSRGWGYHSSDSDDLRRRGNQPDTWFQRTMLGAYPPKKKATRVPPSQDQKELTKLVIDYLVSEGYREAVEALCQEASEDFPPEELNNLNSRVAIRDDIVQGKIEDAIQKIIELCPSLLTEHPEVRFQLHLQNFIEIIRSKDTEKALNYAESHFSSSEDVPEKQTDNLEKTFALLAYENPEESPFKELLNQEHRMRVATDVNAAILMSQNRPSVSRFERLHRMMVWAQQQLLVQREDDHRILAPRDTQGRIVDSHEIARQLFGGQTQIHQFRDD